MATAGDRRGLGPPRAYHDPLGDAGAVVRLDREEAHHLARARRARPGDEVVLFDGRGGTRLGRLVRADGDGADVLVLGPYPDRTPRRRVTIAVAWPDGARADEMISTLAELGVARVVPLVTERSTPDVDARASRRRERHERLAREAAKVNGRSELLVVGTPSPLEALLRAETAGTPGTTVTACRLFLLDTEPGLPSLVSVLPAAPSEVLLLIGPEGGFTEGETSAARAAGATAASLGACALRVETAAAAAAAIALG